MNVAERELAVIGAKLNLGAEQLKVRGLPGDMGPGNVVTITLEHEHIVEVFTGFGEKSRTAESVAQGTCASRFAITLRTARPWVSIWLISC